MHTLLRPQAAVAFIFLTAVLDAVAMGIVIPVLPTLIEQFVGSNSRAGVVNGVFVALWALMQFVASPVVGSLSDRFGRRPVLLLSAAGLAIDYVIIALATNIWWLALGRVIGGITSSTFTAVFAYMADVTPPEKRVQVYGLIGAALSGGLVLGPLLGGVLGEISTRAPFWCAGVLSAMAFLYGVFILPESLPAERRMAFSWKRANPFGAMKLLRSHYELSRLALVNFLMYFAHHMLAAVFVLYAGYRYQWPSWKVGLVLALIGVLDMLVQGVMAAPMARRMGDRGTMIFGLFGGAIGVACMGLAPTGLLFALSMIPNALWGLAAPTLQSLMTQRVSEAEQGQLQGANMSVASLAGVISPIFFGMIYAVTTRGDPRLPNYSGAAFLIASLMLGLAAIFGWIALRRVERDRLAEAPDTHFAVRTRDL